MPKKCSKCGTTQPIEEFWKNKYMPDGHYSVCRTCASKLRYGDGGVNLERKRENERLRKQGIKKCSRCSENKPLEEFSTLRGSRLCSFCKACNADRHRRLAHGVVQAQYQIMFESQGGVCYVCRRQPPEGQVLRVDHDHVTGQVRRLLCHNCNVSLGLLGEDPDWIRALAEYAEWCVGIASVATCMSLARQNEEDEVA